MDDLPTRRRARRAPARAPGGRSPGAGLEAAAFPRRRARPSARCGGAHLGSGHRFGCASPSSLDRSGGGHHPLRHALGGSSGRPPTPSLPAVRSRRLGPERADGRRRRGALGARHLTLRSPHPAGRWDRRHQGVWDVALACDRRGGDPTGARCRGGIHDAPEDGRVEGATGRERRTGHPEWGGALLDERSRCALPHDRGEGVHPVPHRLRVRSSGRQLEHSRCDVEASDP